LTASSPKNGKKPKRTKRTLDTNYAGPPNKRRRKTKYVVPNSLDECRTLTDLRAFASNHGGKLVEGSDDWKNLRRRDISDPPHEREVFVHDYKLLLPEHIKKREAQPSLNSLTLSVVFTQSVLQE